MSLSSKWKMVMVLITISSGLLTSQAQAKDIVGTAVEAGSFKTLATALQAAGLVEALQGEGPFTVFAPTDEAFAKLPEGTVATLLKPENKKQLAALLTYHVVKGKVLAADVVKLKGAKTLNGQQVDIKVADNKVTVDKAQVVKTDIVCDNGVIHVIDAVILPASDPIPVVAQKAGSFSTLVAAVKAAGLAETLSGEGPFTVFAPTDAAFAKLPAGTVESLLKPENKAKLVDILKLHVVSDRVYSSDAVEAGTAKSLLGPSLAITVTDGVARVNKSKLEATDIDASNGVIHVIDAVLLPGTEHQSSALSPRRMIELAIQEGSPLYNAGHHDACAQLYMSTARSLLAMENHGMNATATHQLTQAIAHAEQTTSDDTRAWTMRRALDVAYINAP